MKSYVRLEFTSSVTNFIKYALKNKMYPVDIAKRLGISRQTLWRRMKQLNLNVKEDKEDD